MIGKILGAVVGERIAKQNGHGAVGGALLGAGATALLRRLGPLGLATAIVGGYAVKKYRERRAGEPGTDI